MSSILYFALGVIIYTNRNVVRTLKYANVRRFSNGTIWAFNGRTMFRNDGKFKFGLIKLNFECNEIPAVRIKTSALVEAHVECFLF